jgi:hypothetical protein
VQKEEETHIVDKLICAIDANHCNFDGQGSLYATTQSKSSYLKISEIQE